MRQQPVRRRALGIRDQVILDCMIENKGITHWYDAKTVWCMVNTCGTRECTAPNGAFRPRWSVRQVEKSLKKLVFLECLEVKRIKFQRIYKVIHYYPKQIETFGWGV